MTSAAHRAPKRGDDRGVSCPQAAPVEPYWVDEARKAFARRWHDEHGEDYENSPQVYGDTK